MWLFSLGCILIPNIGTFDPSIVGLSVLSGMLGYDIGRLTNCKEKRSC